MNDLSLIQTGHLQWKPDFLLSQNEVMESLGKNSSPVLSNVNREEGNDISRISSVLYYQDI